MLLWLVVHHNETPMNLLGQVALNLSLLTIVSLSISHIKITKAIASTPKLIADNRYPQDFVSNYLKDCRQSAAEEGVPQQDTQNFCNCTLNQFQSQYSLNEFKQLTQRSNQSQQAADALTEVGSSCFEEILYEEKK